MVKSTGRVHAIIAMSALALMVACGGDKKADTTLAADTALNRDLAMAGSDTAAQPALNDVPATGATKTPTTTTKSTSTRSTSTKTSTPTSTTTKTPAAAPAPKTIGSGSTLALSAGSQICTNTGPRVGDQWTATTTSATTGDNGAVIPAGATVNFKVTQLKRSENARDNIVMAFEVESVSFGGKTYPISGTLSGVSIDRVRNEPKSNDVKKVVGGAVIGAVAGQILGKSTKSTVIGAAAGGAAGAAAAAATANYEGCIRSGSAMTLTLTAPLTLT
jgi:hypothetical protein